MIEAVLIFNNDGNPRLNNWYKPLTASEQLSNLSKVYNRIRTRSEYACSFLEGDTADTRIVYRHYATLYFVFVVDQQESLLGIMDLIQVFVEALDRVFTNVCELDLIFRPDDVLQVLSEIVSGGIVLQVNLENIVQGLKSMQNKARVT